MLLRIAVIATLALSALSAQDSSGNNLLKGPYRFRHLAITSFDQNGGVMEAKAATGTITFDGAGKYTVTGTVIDNTISSGQPQNLSVSGTYGIGAQGLGSLDNPLFPTDSSNAIFGAVAQGIFVGSSTEGTINDIFIAIPPGTATNASFNQTYWAGSLDFNGPSSSAIKNSLFAMTPNGQGGFGAITFQGQAANQSATGLLMQTVSGATYSIASDGSISLNVPLASGVSTTNALFTGAKTMFQSADGNFLLGWTAGGYDIFFGVKALTSTGSNSIYQGEYYFGALEATPGSGNSCGETDSYYGSLVSDGSGNQIVHDRLVSAVCNAIDFEIDDQTQISSNGTTNDLNGYQYAFGVGGQAFVAIGTSGLFSLIAGVHSNNFSGPGVFLNPLGVANAASYAPITMSLAPGELVVLTGTGPFPTTLGNVQVLVNGTPAPIYYVSPQQIAAILPYSVATATNGRANIQVSNNGTLSNTVSLFVSDTAPGIFSQTQNGLGFAAAVHAATGALVTTSNPARAGEFLAVFLTGLGAVTPKVADGAPGPTSPLSTADVSTNNNLTVYFDDYTNSKFPQATVQFAGLAPGLAGLYQLNVQVPTGIGPGNVYIEVVTNTADVLQITVPVAAGSGASAAAAVKKPRVRSSGEKRSTLSERKRSR